MRTRLELTLEIEHPDDYDPANQFVWYFCFDDVMGFDPQPKDIHVQREAWWQVR